MKYFKGQQFVPMKGTASMYYETDDADNVVRFMTAFTEIGEVEKTMRPPIKKLFRPELLESIEAAEFETWWSQEK